MENKFNIIDMDLPWEKLKDAKVLVTGGNGLIASTFVEKLMLANKQRALSCAVYVLCRSEEKARNRFAQYLDDPKFRLIIQDVIEPLQMDIAFDYIIHAASSAHPGAFNSVPVDVMKANFLGTLNLLDYTVKHGNGRFMFVSSSEVYGENEEGIEIFDENERGNVNHTTFRGCYPESKRASETLCMCYKKQYDANVVVVRPAFIYGKNILESNTRADVYFLKQVMNKEDIVMYSKGTQIRSYCYVDDCVSGMLYALLLGENGEVYNIGNEDCVVTMWEYAQKLAEIGGVQLHYKPETRPEDKVFLKTTKLILNTAKLRNLGWKPMFTLENGLRDILH